MPGNDQLRETLRGMSPQAGPPDRPEPPQEGTSKPPGDPPPAAEGVGKGKPEKSPGELVKSFGSFLEARETNLAQLLPKHMEAKRLIRIAVNEFAYNDKLRLCTPLSIYGSLLQSAATGLEIGVGGQSYLIPYKNKKGEYLCKWVPGYKGLITLVRRTGEIADIRTEIVYQGDRFNIELGMPNRGFVHTPKLQYPRGPIWLVYGVAEYVSGGYHFEHMLKEEIDLIRQQYSKAQGDDIPWRTSYPEMSRKTVFRRMAKWLPASIELQTALTLDHLSQQNRRADVIDGVVIPADPEPESAGVMGDPFGDDIIDMK